MHSPRNPPNLRGKRLDRAQHSQLPSQDYTLLRCQIELHTRDGLVPIQRRDNCSPVSQRRIVIRRWGPESLSERYGRVVDYKPFISRVGLQLYLVLVEQTRAYSIDEERRIALHVQGSQELPQLKLLGLIGEMSE